MFDVLFAVAPLFLSGALLLWVAFRAARLTLPMSYPGIRTPTVLRTELTWKHGNAAAALPMAIAGSGIVAASVSAVVLEQTLLPVIAAAVWTGTWLLIGAIAAHRAVRELSTSDHAAP